MRPILSLDDDVAALLHEAMRRSGASLEDTVNQYLRLELTASKQTMQKRFVVKPLAMGLPPGLSYDKVAELIEALEGPNHR